MNIKIKIALILLITAVMAAGCKKEEINDIQKNKHVKTLYRDICDGVTEEYGILCVQSHEQLLLLINELDSLQDIYSDNVASEYLVNFTDEQCVQFCDTTTLDFYYPFTEFEGRFNYVSLRSFLLCEEEDWLATTSGENINNDPDNHYIDDDALRTILNRYAEVKIGDVYYRFLENGHFETTDINTLILTRNGLYTNEMNGYVITDTLYRLECNSGKSRSNYITNSSETRRIKWVVSHRTPFPSGRYVQAKTVNYYKKNGHWKKYATACISQVYGKISGMSGNCSDYYIFNTFQGPCKYKLAGKSVKHKMRVQTMTKSAWVHGYHKGADGLSYTSTLVFPN